MKRTRLIIAEDHGMVSGALSALLGLEPDMEVVGCAGDGHEALALLEATEVPVDLVLTDIEMPGMDGLALTEHLQARPGAPAVVIVTTFARPGYLQRALEAGAVGYLLKDSPAQELVQAIRQVRNGERVVAPSLAAQALAERNPLTPRERDVLRLALQGLSGAQIARQVSLSPGTVRNYLSEAISKLGASNRVEAARLAAERGWL
ncbi:MAG: response regulator transcription factor [Pseudomonadota bacterium]